MLFALALTLSFAADDDLAGCQTFPQGAVCPVAPGVVVDGDRATIGPAPAVVGRRCTLSSTTRSHLHGPKGLLDTFGAERGGSTETITEVLAVDGEGPTRIKLSYGK